MKYSKQREMILDYISNSSNHPNADMVYKEIKKNIPHISLGTIYRNLNLLCDLKLIKRIITPDECVNFDKIDISHNHIYCDKCKKLYDISNTQFETIKNNIKKETGHLINPFNSIFVGMCHNCLKERNEK